MKHGTPRFLPYRWRGSAEWMLMRGPDDGPQVIVLAPLFAEMNLTRALLAELGRALAERGVGSWLPDLPGTGESRRPLGAVSWEDWLDVARTIGEEVASRIGTRPFVCSVRGGALLDHAIGARARWRYAPAEGSALLRQLGRAQQIADRESGAVPAPPGEPAELAGYMLSPAMRSGLEAAHPAPGAEREMANAGAALWRRAEPGRDDTLAHTLAADICDWIKACGDR